MELPNSSISRGTLVHPTPTPFPVIFSVNPLRKTKWASSFSRKSYKFPLHPPFSFNPPLSTSSSRFRISAQIGRQADRQNHLRKKLTQKPQVSESSDFSKRPLEDFDTDAIDSKTDSFSEKRANLDGNSGVIDNVGESSGAPLEGLLDKPREESGFWGIGTEPIFTVYQDSNGNVERVFVNEDEILRRSGVDPVLYKEGLVKGLAQVNSRLLFAATVAREIGKRRDLLPGTSSVVKYVSSSRDSGIINGTSVPAQLTINETSVPAQLTINETSVPTQLTINDTSVPAQLTANDTYVPAQVTTNDTYVPAQVTINDTSVPAQLTIGPVSGSGNVISFRQVSRFGVGVMCALFLFSTIKNFFTTVDNDRQENSKIEEEMLRRKVKARMNKEKNVTGGVEVIEDSDQPGTLSGEKPELDKEELMEKIIEAKGKTNSVQFPPTMGSKDTIPVHLNDKIQEIREMARRARELEKTESSRKTDEGEDDQILKKVLQEKESIQKLTLVHEASATELTDGFTGQTADQSCFTLSNDNSHGNSMLLTALSSSGNSTAETDEIAIVGLQEDIGSSAWDSAVSPVKFSNAVQMRDQGGLSDHQATASAEEPPKRRVRVIQSVKEAREYLSKKLDGVQERVPLEGMTSENLNMGLSKTVAGTSERLVSAGNNRSGQVALNQSETVVNIFENPCSPKATSSPFINGKPEIIGKRGEQTCDFETLKLSETDASSLAPKEEESDIETNRGLDVSQKVSMDDSPFLSSSISCEKPKFGENQITSKEQNFERGDNIKMTGSSVNGKTSNKMVSELALSDSGYKWIEKNFHELEPLVAKMGVGFRDNYMVAKGKTSEDMNSAVDMLQLMSDNNGDELEWMKDESLREIVFKVRDNELAGRDPFHSMAEEEKLAFFDGLEKKVEKENENLLNLHEWLHSSIENLDYGTDGISIYDPPEKIIPRWKGPPAENIREFFKRPRAEHEAPSDLMKHTGDSSSPDMGNEPHSSNRLSTRSPSSDPNAHHPTSPSISSRTIIEGSDGSIKAGKKSGKEYWQHTKRWSQGFLESYNAESDPEIKNVMKDIGKDLDRWITEKEVQEAGELLDKLPEKGQKFIKKKLDKVKREMELFGPQAVVSKYREYADEKEEDYLWWLDLPFVLCIEMYTEKEGEEQVGFYSLEMAADLELDPKQYHVIAFEDAGDCKQLCYIIQAHMEMLGNGNAFAVAQKPKDAFREAKANGFGVTVLRKGQLQLNVDQTLEEVEELIAEIGSKIYHDKIMRERSMDISSAMKGVFGLKRPVRRKRSKRKLKKPSES